MGRGRGTWDARTQGCQDVGLGDSETQGRGTQGRGDVGLGDAGTWKHGDVGMRGRGDAGHGDVGHEWGGDKQTIPEFCAEFAIYSFWWLNRLLSENSSCKQFQVGTNCWTSSG